MTPELATVELVTSATFRVGGVATDGSGGRCFLVVGGLSPAPDEPDRGLRLAVHNPQVRGLVRGIVRVEEPEALLLDEGAARLADGYLLGELRRSGERGEAILWVKPGLDYETGLYHVVALRAVDPALKPVPDLEDLFDARSWTKGSLLAPGDASSWRSTQKLRHDPRAAIREGAALRSGARFVGRVGRVTSPGRADVRLLGDPGLAFPGLALIAPVGVPADGDTRPRLVELGRLVTEASDQEGKLRLRYEALAPLARAITGEAVLVRAELYTGSGDAGVPLGLRVGEAWLPTGAGTQVIVLDGTERIASLRSVELRVGDEEVERP